MNVDQESVDRYVRAHQEWADTTRPQRAMKCTQAGMSRWVMSLEVQGWWCCDECGRTAKERTPHCYPLFLGDTARPGVPVNRSH